MLLYVSMIVRFDLVQGKFETLFRDWPIDSRSKFESRIVFRISESRPLKQGVVRSEQLGGLVRPLEIFLDPALPILPHLLSTFFIV